MKETISITSLQNPRVKSVIKLRKAKTRKKLKQTVVEGFREILRATESNWSFQELYFCPSLFPDHKTNELVLTLKAKNIPIFECSENVFRKISYRDTPDGLLAVSSIVGCTFNDLSLPNNPLILVAENLEKPGNLGTILRTADATGVDAVIVCGEKTDINNPNVIRASIGTLFFMPIVETSSDNAREWLRTHNIQALSAIPDATTNYTEVDMQEGIAIVVGSEDEGLSSLWQNETCQKISIPMRGKNDSLNVSTAAAILLYEAVRQRS